MCVKMTPYKDITTDQQHEIRNNLTVQQKTKQTLRPKMRWSFTY